MEMLHDISRDDTGKKATDVMLMMIHMVQNESIAHTYIPIQKQYHIINCNFIDMHLCN